MAETDKWKELRKPFDPKVIGKIPKGGIMLDYVGHAAVTDRLLSVDPTWTWEPMATDEHGAPMSASGNLWIKLTVNGVTRIGVGDGKNAKECISDAIRNAAMRFGVALDLWSKEELESTLEDPSMKNLKPAQAPVKHVITHGNGEIADTTLEMMTDIQKRQIKAFLTANQVPEADFGKFLWSEFGVTPDKITKQRAIEIMEALK
jgi:hypothetical protein